LAIRAALEADTILSEGGYEVGLSEGGERRGVKDEVKEGKNERWTKN
jgi:hypothetical protein